MLAQQIVLKRVRTDGEGHDAYWWCLQSVQG